MPAKFSEAFILTGIVTLQNKKIIGNRSQVYLNKKLFTGDPTEYSFEGKTLIDLFSHTSVSSEISGVFVLFTAISLEEKECPVHNR